MQDRVAELLRAATRRALAEIGEIGAADLGDEVMLSAARSREHGDLASNAALSLAKRVGIPPRELAERIVSALEDPDGLIDRVEIAGPGFINFTLVSGEWHSYLDRALSQGAGFGVVQAAAPRRIQVEFVSANPTGPLTIGHGRNAVLGDAVARLLEAVGHDVSREYYFNDGGRQMRVLAESLRARYEQELGSDTPLPQDGYQGEYLAEVARALIREQADAWLEADEAQFKKYAQDAIFSQINATLERLGIRFDSYYNENSLYEEGLVEQVLGDLRERDLVYEEEGAVWLRATEFGRARNRVLIKSSGEATYLLPDIAYHREKFRRGFQLLIDVLGPDHIEQFPYVRDATAALGHDPGCVEFVMYQWVNLRSGGAIVKMSTRTGSFVTIDEVLDEVGADAFRYFMIDRRADTHLDFDLDLARERSERNPVYKIQYAHARLCSIGRKAAEQGHPAAQAGTADYGRLVDAEEKELAVCVGRYPELVAKAAEEREPQMVARYLLELANAFNAYVSDSRRHKVISDDEELSRARLALAQAVRIALGNGLELLGIQAPERM